MSFRPLAAFLLCGVLAGLSPAAAGESRSGSRTLADSELGRQLFLRDWLADVPAGSPLEVARGGDGLGPLFNATSCVACHRLGGAGGAGPNENDVAMLSLALPFGSDEPAKLAARQQAGLTHPAFFRDASVTLHRFGRDEDGSFDRYDRFRQQLKPSFGTFRPTTGTADIGGQRYELSRRNTPALFGLGAIDRISPEVLRTVAALQTARFPQFAGQPSLDGLGRFGWRAQATSLTQFVEGACANELGLRIVGNGRAASHDQAAWPLDGPPAPAERSPADLTPHQVRALARFVASLPAPRPERATDADAGHAAAAGLAAFRALDCGVCHVQNLGLANSIFSDLLLHDMGSLLADRVAAPTPSSAAVSNGYYGTSAADRYATLAWRTPPLWGVADSAPYLHDGRAETLDAAIRLHGGQAAPVAAAYADMAEPSRRNLLAFLGTLRAPR